MTQVEPDTIVVLGCIALGLLSLVATGAVVGWALCLRHLRRKAERIFIVDREGQRHEALVLEEQQC